MIGKVLSLLIVFTVNYVNAQCPGIKEIIGIYENETSYLNDLNFSFDERLSSIDYKGTTFSANLNSYIGKNNSNKIISDFDGYLEFKSQSSTCFTNIKDLVAKEVGNKVYSKEVSENNGWYIESYQHMSKDLYIQFHKSSEYYGYKVVVISSSKIEFFQNQIYKIEQQQAVDNEVSETIRRARDYLNEKKYDEAEREISNAKKTINYRSVSENISNQVNSFLEELNSSRFQDFRSDIYKLIGSNQFVKAKNKIISLNNNDNSNTSKIKTIEIELNNKAVFYYTQKFITYKESNQYQYSIKYSDSVLLFSPSDKSALSNKSEMRSILDFLTERKTKTYDYWQNNFSLKNELSNDYKEKCYSLMTGKSNGSISFDLGILTDTSCNIKPNLTWKSSQIDAITFGQSEISKYNIQPFEKYGYCAKSSANISFNLNWSKTKYKFKYISGEFKSKHNVNDIITTYLTTNYPEIKGKVSFTENIVSFNNNDGSILYLNSFKTRGPLNAIYALVLPGLGTYRVTYGQKGLGVFLCFAGSVAAILYGGDSKIVAIGAFGLATTYVWDFSSTIIRGSKNLINTKYLRRSLRQKPIQL